MIFHDSTLKLIASVKPREASELTGIKGIGEIKIKRFGNDIINIVTGGDYAG